MSGILEIHISIQRCALIQNARVRIGIEKGQRKGENKMTSEMNLTNLIEMGLSKGYIEILKKNDINYIKYIHIEKEYNFDDPE